MTLRRMFSRVVRYLLVLLVLASCAMLRSSRVAAVETSGLDAPQEVIAFQAGEELEYSVTFLSIRLGTVKIKTVGSETRDGRTVWHCFCYADSREGIPFVSLHVVYESRMDEQGGYSHEFLGSEQGQDGKWVYTKYKFDYPAKKIFIENGQGATVWRNIEIHSPSKFCDGLSLFFYARRNAMYKKTVSVPTIIANDTAHTIIEFPGERESQDIDAVNYSVDCNHFTGNATWTGVYGLTGHFEGWFSNDRASIPIKASIKILVGSAWIELVKWKRADWAPPKAG